MDRRWRGGDVGGLAAACAFGVVWFAAFAWLGPTDRAEGAAFEPSVRPAFSEPVTLESTDGVLEVRLTAQQGEISLDTVATPVKNAILFSYELIRGAASNGEASGANQYPAPTLQVQPGDKLIVHLDNALFGLTIRDYYDPQFSAKNEAVPLYPKPLTQAPINLHTHGLHVSPKGNGDNVLLHVGAGLSNTYVYDIPEDHWPGVYWYHPHLHGQTSPQVYFGLAGVIAIGRIDGEIPAVTENDLPIRNMVLQYNYVFDRKGGLAQLNNPNWPQYVSTLEPPKGDELAKGTYRPLLTPVNFGNSNVGTEHFTVWYTGKLSVDNNRGHFQFIPSNLQTFTADPDGSGHDIPADPSLPDHQRDIQFTVNGQFQPVIESKPGQTEIWILSNVSDMAYMNVRFTETATGRHPKIAILATDGNTAPTVRYPVAGDGTRLLIPPATRFTIAVTMPETGDLVLEMPPLGYGARAISENGILYTNDGTDNPPASLGSLTVLPSALSYNDGFFLFPTQVLAKAVPSGERGVTVPFVEGQELHADSGFEDLSQLTPDFTRQLDVTGGFLNDLASPNDPKSFVYAFNSAGFPNPPLLQPRLGSVEEWTIQNYNNDAHPIHVHVNDFQVTRYYDPTTGTEIGPGMWTADNANLPQPTLVRGQEGDVAQPAVLSFRTKFRDYIGRFVMHCHRLNHEDNGLMLIVNIIPAVSTYAVVVPGSQGQPAVVEVYDGNGDRLLATVTPFPGDEGVPSAAMGDVDGDGIYDLVVGAGKDHAPEVVVYSGKETFGSELTRFAAFASDARGGLSVVSTQIDGTISDNIIVGSGPGVPSEVKVFAYKASRAGAAPELFSSFNPYPGDRSGVTVAAGLVSLMSGRNSIVTAPGPGSPAKVRVFDYWLMTPLSIKIGETNVPLQLCSPDAAQPAMIAEITPFGSDYRGGVSLAIGELYGEFGGTERIIVSQLTGPGVIKVYSSGSALQGGPALYLKSPVEHSAKRDFSEDVKFMPFVGPSGVRVAATTTRTGADLLVSGVAAENETVQVVKYRFVQPDTKVRKVAPIKVSEVASAAGSVPHVLGGD